MQFKALLLSLLLPMTAFAGNYELVSVPHDEIDSYLTIGNDANGTPKNLQGLWWMNGNPLPDEVVSFAGAVWQPEFAYGQQVGWVALISVYDQGIWSWHDSIAGRLLYSLAESRKLRYEAHFNLDFTDGLVLPKFKPFGTLPTVKLPDSMFLEFTMTQVNENEFSRDSIILGQPSSYRFRRIVDADGRRLPAFDEYLDKVEVENAILPYCKFGNGSLPTPCID